MWRKFWNLSKSTLNDGCPFYIVFFQPMNGHTVFLNESKAFTSSIFFWSSNEHRSVSNETLLVQDVHCLVSDEHCLVSDEHCLLSDVHWSVSDEHWSVRNTFCLVSSAHCLASSNMCEDMLSCKCLSVSWRTTCTKQPCSLYGQSTTSLAQTLVRWLFKSILWRMRNNIRDCILLLNYYWTFKKQSFLKAISGLKLTIRMWPNLSFSEN
jgi:hypothetical protein